MSQQQEQMTVSDAVDGFDTMAARQVTMHSWRVLSWRNDSVTAHKVNLRKMSCTCADHQYNQNGDGEVCDHLAKSLFCAERHMDVGEALNYDLLEHQRELAEMLERLDTVVTTSTSEVTETEQTETQQTQPNSESQPSSKTDGDVEEVIAWLSDEGLPMEKIKVWRDDDYGSIQIEPDGYLDDSWDTWCDVTDHDSIWQDQESDNNRHFITQDNLQEVLSS